MSKHLTRRRELRNPSFCVNQVTFTIFSQKSSLSLFKTTTIMHRTCSNIVLQKHRHRLTPFTITNVSQQLLIFLKLCFKGQEVLCLSVVNIYRGVRQRRDRFEECNFITSYVFVLYFCIVWFDTSSIKNGCSVKTAPL